MSAMPRRAKVIRFPKSPPPEPPAGGLVEVRRCRDQAEALVVRALLDSHGIPTALRSNLAQSVHPFSVGDQGETVILVPGDDLERARRVLSGRVARPQRPVPQVP